MNYWITESLRSGGLGTVHGLFLSLDPAKAAFRIVAAGGRSVLLYHHGRILERTAP